MQVWSYRNKGVRTTCLQCIQTQYMHFRLHTNYFLLLWKIPEEISRRWMLFNNWRQYLQYQTCIHTTFYHGSGLTWNWTFNGSIHYVWYLHILHFYFVWQHVALCGITADVWIKSSILSTTPFTLRKSLLVFHKSCFKLV